MIPRRVSLASLGSFFIAIGERPDSPGAASDAMSVMALFSSPSGADRSPGSRGAEALLSDRMMTACCTFHYGALLTITVLVVSTVPMVPGTVPTWYKYQVPGTAHLIAWRESIIIHPLTDVSGTC
jgi:hypothetical protein